MVEKKAVQMRYCGFGVGGEIEEEEEEEIEEEDVPSLSISAKGQRLRKSFLSTPVSISAFLAAAPGGWVGGLVDGWVIGR